MTTGKLVLVGADEETVKTVKEFASKISLDLYIRQNTLPSLVESSQGVLAFPVKSVQSSNKTMKEIEADAIAAAVEKCRGNLTEAAKCLQIGRATLYRKIKEHNIDTASWRKAKAA